MSLEVLKLFKAVIKKVGIFVNSLTLSTVDGAIELRFAFTVSLDVEKNSFGWGTGIAGMAYIVLASNDSPG